MIIKYGLNAQPPAIYEAMSKNQTLGHDVEKYQMTPEECEQCRIMWEKLKVYKIGTPEVMRYPMTRERKPVKSDTPELEILPGGKWWYNEDYQDWHIREIVAFWEDLIGMLWTYGLPHTLKHAIKYFWLYPGDSVWDDSALICEWLCKNPQYI